MARRDAEFHGSVRHLLTLDPPTREHEQELLARMAQGDAAAREELALRMGQLIASIAARYLDHEIPHEDLFMEGMGGCLEALDKWEHGRTCRVATYAGHWIEMRIRRAIAYQSRTIRLTERALTQERRARRGQPISAKWQHALTHAARVAASLDAPITGQSTEPDTLTLGETVADQGLTDPDHALDVGRLLNQPFLDERDKALLWGVHAEGQELRVLAAEFRMRLPTAERAYRTALLRLRVVASVPGARSDWVQLPLPVSIPLRALRDPPPEPRPAAPRSPTEAGRRPKQRLLPLKRSA